MLRINASDRSEDIYVAIRFATQTIEILEDHDNMKKLDCFSNHRKQLKEWHKIFC